MGELIANPKTVMETANHLAVLDESVAIVVDGNKTSHTGGASIGQYVLLKNSTISGRTDGAYKAAKAIPYNTALDSTYLTAIDGGIANELNSNLGGYSFRLDTVTFEEIPIGANDTQGLAWYNPTLPTGKKVVFASAETTADNAWVLCTANIANNGTQVVVRGRNIATSTVGIVGIRIFMLLADA